MFWVTSWKQEEQKRMRDDMAVYSRYLMQRMKMIWTLPLRFLAATHIDKKEVIALVVCNMKFDWTAIEE